MANVEKLAILKELLLKLVQRFESLGDGDVVLSLAASEVIYNCCVKEHKQCDESGESLPENPDHKRDLRDVTKYVTQFDSDNTGYVNWKRILAHLLNDQLGTFTTADSNAPSIQVSRIPSRNTLLRRCTCDRTRRKRILDTN